jgi:hypothetical protein
MKGKGDHYKEIDKGKRSWGLGIVSQGRYTAYCYREDTG